MDDSKIVDLYLARDEQAIAETRKRYGSALRTISLNIVRDRRDAEECESSTYLEAWNSIPPNEPRSHLFSYLAKIIQNLSLNVYQSRHTQKRDAVVLELSQELEACVPAARGAETVVDDMAIQQAINRLLERLSEQHRLVFMRRYFYADPISVIAGNTGLSEANVKVILHRCRTRLKELLGQEGIDL